MRLTINGETREVAPATLSEFMALLGYEGDWLATAVNGEIVHRDERAGFELKESDRVEILSPMQGG